MHLTFLLHFVSMVCFPCEVVYIILSCSNDRVLNIANGKLFTVVLEIVVCLFGSIIFLSYWDSESFSTENNFMYTGSSRHGISRVLCCDCALLRA